MRNEAGTDCGFNFSEWKAPEAARSFKLSMSHLDHHTFVVVQSLANICKYPHAHEAADATILRATCSKSAGDPPGDIQGD